MSDRSDYEALIQKILENNADVDSEFDKVGNAAQTTCDINGIAEQLNISVVRNNRGDVIGYDKPYTYPNDPNLPLMDADSNTDHGIFGYATGGGGFTRGGGAGRYAGSYYDRQSRATLGTVDETGNKSFVSGLISSAWAGVSALGKLGKKVGSQAADVMEAFAADYELNFGPLCVKGDTEGVANAIRVLFGVDDQGNTTMYMDQDTIGALAIQARDNGLFVGGYDVDDYSSEPGIYESTLNFLRNNFPTGFETHQVHRVRAHFVRGSFQEWRGWDFSQPVYVVLYHHDDVDYYGNPTWWFEFSACREHPFTYRTADSFRVDETAAEFEEIMEATSWSNPTEVTVNDLTFWTTGRHGFSYQQHFVGSTPFNFLINHVTQEPIYAGEAQLGYLVLTRATGSEPIPGIEDQPDATIPVDAITGADPHVVGQNLYNQYPDVMGAPIAITTLDDSCNEVHQNYFSIPISFGYQDGLDVNVDANVPITGVGQLNPSFNPDISIDPSIDLSKYMEQVINQLSGSGAGRDIVRTDPSTGQPSVLPTVPPSTGQGLTPPPVLPETGVVGMWHVYNPTSSEVSALGSWLWSTNIIDQIVRIFTNPMEAIIGLHAVYAEPTVSGSQAIVVGNLTSNVSARVVTKQYATVDCGTVWLTEYFGNVFDYDPFTKVSLFLPFIGIVDLNVADVMRASISVTYNIDMYTGACIAMVDVSRDGAGGVLYEYSGCCAIQYPISASNYSSMLQAIISAGVAAVGSGVASGGNPAMGAMAAGATYMNTASISVRRSGSFSGNPGAMGPKRPYLIITRPQTNMAINFDSYDGRGSNYTSRIGDNVGYVKCKEVHLNVPGAFANELAEIESLLKSGVMLKDYAVSKSIEPEPEPSPVSRLMVSENGTYTPTGIYVGFNPVVVDVPDPELEELDATTNGVYTPTVYGYSQVTVNVQPALQEKSVTQNGRVTPDSGYYGLSSVIVNVSGGGGTTVDLKIGDVPAVLSLPTDTPLGPLSSPSRDYIIPMSNNAEVKLDLTQPFEICCRFKIGTAPGSTGRNIWGSRNSYYYFPAIAVSSTEIMYYITTNGSSWNYSGNMAPSGYSLPLNTWITAIMQWDGTGFAMSVNDGTNTYTASVPNITPYYTASYTFEIAGQNRSGYSISACNATVDLANTYMRQNGVIIWGESMT